VTYIAFTKVKLPYGWMGNMSPHPVAHGGLTWRTTEALFHALRLPEGHEGREKIREQKSPMAAKMVSKTLKDDYVVEPWSTGDVTNMIFCVKLKMDQYPDLMEQLLATGDLPIYEDVSSRDHGSGSFWGASNKSGAWVGENILGQILMEIREENRTCRRAV
jgi:ribA/ribD-fused uncharacterized protein